MPRQQYSQFQGRTISNTSSSNTRPPHRVAKTLPSSIAPSHITSSYSSLKPLTTQSQGFNPFHDDDDDDDDDEDNDEDEDTIPSSTTSLSGSPYRCYDHGCNGRPFSTQCNLTRHQKENSSQRSTYSCDKCGAVFSRTSARNQHVARKSCNRIRRYSNGRVRPEIPVGRKR